MMQIPNIDTSNTTTLLGSFIGVLLAFIAALYMYFKEEVKVVRTELKAERDYGKAQDLKNIETLVHVNNVLNQVTKEIEKTSLNVSDIKIATDVIKPLAEANTDRIKQIKNHLDNGK